ncbi:MAG: PQQ-dependent sugar dehydrogenase, partial [Ignavibacteriae bacterium]|nr:PQQ-dependent sugar dehydrogenase [Ignavibacteriota bacterium]
MITYKQSFTFSAIILFLTVLISLEAMSQFRIDTLAKAPDIGFPVCIAFPPDGSNRVFFTEKNTGKVRIIRNDSLLATPFLTASVTGTGEQGLLGITFHPQYPDSPFIYIYYTRSGDRANLLIRYEDQNGIGVNPVTLLVVLRQNGASNHNGGNIHFGPDGKLYVTIGEYAENTNSQDTSNGNKRGKIHRFNPDGSIPSDNPFPGNSIFAYGCRNSFDFSFDELTGKMYASENGPSCDDEVNHIVSGGNYGWPVEGNCSYSNDPQYKRPMYYWSSGLPAVTGIAVYRGNAFPDLYGKLFVAGNNSPGIVYQFNLAATGDSITGAPTTFLNYGSGITDIEIGPDGFIYLSNGTYGGASRILRLRPNISVPPIPTQVSPPNNSISQPRRPTVVWRKAIDATSYYLQLSTDSLFSSLVFNDSTLTDTTKLMSPLSYNTKYFWKVKAKNSLGTSAFSSVWNFTTVVATPQAPTLESPENNSTHTTTTVPLRWRISPTTETYQIQISSDSLFTSLVVDSSSIADTMLTFTSASHYASYFWRVRATNVGGTSGYSQTWKFSIVDYVTASIFVNNRWNLLSVPVQVPDKRKQNLFPDASSQAFTFVPLTGYVTEDSLENGIGYWLKFDSTETVSLLGGALSVDTLEVN